MGSEAVWKRKRKKFGFVDHSPTPMSGTVNRTHEPNWKRKSTKKKRGLEARNKGKKMASKHQVFTAVSWNTKVKYVHSRRRRKKKQGVNVRRTYRLEKEKVTTSVVCDVIREVLGPAFQKAGVEVVFCDNDKKLQSRGAEETWAEFGIQLWPGAGCVTNKAIGGFPVDRPALNPLDQSIHAAWKTHRGHGSLYELWNARKPSRRREGGFMNDLDKSWENLPMRKIRAAIDCQRKIIREMHRMKGAITTYDTD